MTASIISRDARDLRILQLADTGMRPRAIARQVGVPLDVVETILQADAAAFPSEPQGRRT